MVRVQSHERRFGRRLLCSGGDLEKGGAFVDLVEHRAIDHGASPAHGVLDLAPVEPASAARDLIEGRPPLEVVPGKAREDDRQVIHAVRSSLRDVPIDLLAVETVRRRPVAKPSHRPGTDHVEGTIDPLPPPIPKRVVTPGPPAARHAADQGDAIPGLGIALEEIH